MAAEKTVILRIQVDGFGTANKDLEFLTTETAKLTAEKRKASTESQNAAKVLIAEEGSVAKLRATTALLRQEYNNMGLTTKEAVKRHEELGKQINANAEKIRDYDRKISGSNTLVGEYSRGIKEAFGEITKSFGALGSAIGGATGEIIEASSEFATATGAIGGTTGKITEASSEFATATGAIGGATGKITEASSEFATAAGVIGIVVAGIALLAKTWKEANENIKLYLESADKLKYGSSGFQQDADAALKETVKRAKGGVTEGTRLEAEAKNLLLLRKNITDEQRQALELQIKEGQQMQADNNELLQSMGKNLNTMDSITQRHEAQLTWKLKYRDLLKEEESINDDRLVKETEWEALEADLVKQRAIVSSLESTAAEKKQASIEADKIANKLVKEKTEFLDRQIANVTAISEMTATQEVVEDQLNGLLKEKNTIQKEYYSDQVKINKLERQAAKDLKQDQDEAKKRAKELHDQDVEAYKEAEKFINDWLDEKKKADDDAEKYRIDSIERQYKAAEKSAEDQWKNDRKREEDAKKEEEKKEKEVKDIKTSSIQAIDQISGLVFQSRRDRLNAEMNAELSNANLTEAQKSAIKRKYALQQQKSDIAQATVNAALAITKTFAEYGFTPASWVAAAALAATTAVQIGIIKAQKFASGGRISGGARISPDSNGDDTLIIARQGEVILNQQQQLRLGGARTFKNLGVPGFASGGLVGASNLAQSPGMNFTMDYEKLINGINDKYVILRLTDLDKAQNIRNVIVKGNDL